jgi:hypothetical protein
MAQITMSLDEWNQHLAEKAALAVDAAKANAHAAGARLTNLDEAGFQAARLDHIVRSALTIVRFAVGNLPAETTPNWPIAALDEVIKNLDALPTFGSDDVTLQIELRTLLAEIIEQDRARKARALKRVAEQQPSLKERPAAYAGDSSVEDRSDWTQLDGDKTNNTPRDTPA